MHAGVMVSMSDSVFEDNLAGSEGPAVLSLGLLKNLVGVSFSGNGFYCAAGLYSTEAPVVSSGRRAFGEEMILYLKSFALAHLRVLFVHGDGDTVVF